MVRVVQLVLSLLSLSHNEPTADLNDHHFSTIPSRPDDLSPAGSKSVAIVGAGSAGLAVLKTLFDLPYEVRRDWDIVLYEQRRDVGGVWLPDTQPPSPPTLPETPLYPLLHTNTPHPTMTYPGFTFPPNTPLFPSHEYVEQYHVDYAVHYNLTSHIHLNHTVLAASWRGNSIQGKWDLEISRSTSNPTSLRHSPEKDVFVRSFDHLIVANGHNHYPYVPQWNGTDEWLANTPRGFPQREVLHSIFYRDPEHYANRSVIIVGAGASGRDAALQVGPVAREVYHSLRNNSFSPPGAKVIPKPPISHFTNTSVVFIDGSSLASVDTLILATGYSFLVPFLSKTTSTSNNTTPALIASPSTHVNSTTATTLSTNFKYIYPLYEHIFSLSLQYPSTALAFVGLPVLIANCPSDVAQSLLVAHAIADPSILPSRSDMLAALVKREDEVRRRGYDPYVVGHKMVGGDTEAQDYQDAIVRFMKQKGKLPNDGGEFVEQWRRDARRDSKLLDRAWKRVQENGEEREWLENVKTENEWVVLMTRLAAWQREWEKAHGEQPDGQQYV